MRPVPALPILALLLPVLPGCAHSGAFGGIGPAGPVQGVGGSGTRLGPTEGPEVPWDVAPVVWSAVEVFERYRLPVARADEFGGVVETERFRVHTHWEGIPAAEIISCLNLSSASPAEVYSRAFLVTIAMHARDAGRGNTRIEVTGSAEMVDTGVGSADRMRCVVREEFRAGIADEIRRDVMRLPPRRRSD